MALTAEQRIEKAHVAIMGHSATLAYSSLIMVGKSFVADEVPTAYTNGRDKTYGRGFVDKLTDAELVGVILHECGHMVYQHPFLWKHLWVQDRQLANMAADYVINIEIDEMSKKHPSFVKLPSMALLDYAYKGMDTQQVFNKLKENGGNRSEGFDIHDFEDLPEEEKKELMDEIEAAVRQGILLANKMGGDKSRGFASLTAPRVDWREQLREFTSAVAVGKDLTTWRRPNRRWLQQDMFMPSTYSETIGSVAVVVDSSGSVWADDQLVSAFMSEVIGVCNMVNPSQVHFISCDAVVQSHEVYGSDNYDALADKRELKGGGGTDMRVALNYIDKQGIDPEVIIVLTDGYTPWPSALTKPTLWAITTKETAPVGTTIHLEV